MIAIADQYADRPRLPGLKVDLGDEVLYWGPRWWLDDERLKGLQGQGDLGYEDFDLRDVEPADRAKGTFADETGNSRWASRSGRLPGDLTFRTGETVPVPDGVYVGEEGAVVIHDGWVAKVTSHLHDMWGGWREPRDLLHVP